MKKFSTACVALFAVALTGCVTNPIPEGYTGPRATIRDTGYADGNSRGFSMSPVFISREVPANKPLTLKLIGSHAYSPHQF
jgi:hypothetical protein